jgi:hypothetical protein
MTDQAEALLACTGLGQVLAGTPPTRDQLTRSTQLDEELLAAVVAYLGGGRSSAPPATAMPAELPPDLPPDAHGAVTGLDQDVATGYGLAAARALAYLNGLAPRRKLPGLASRTGQPRLADRSGSEGAELRRAWQVVEGPLAVLGDLDAVTEDQLEALRYVYPTLWSGLGLQAAEGMAEVDRDLTQREERTLGRLMGTSTDDVEDLQALHKPPKGGEQQGAPPGDGAGPDLASPVQQLQGRDAAGK